MIDFTSLISCVSRMCKNTPDFLIIEIDNPVWEIRNKFLLSRLFCRRNHLINYLCDSSFSAAILYKSGIKTGWSYFEI